MGADSEIFVFDFEWYSRKILPVFYQFLLTGVPPDWLEPVVRHLQIPTDQWRPVDLQSCCTYLGADLSWTGMYDDVDLTDSGWDQRSCKSSECRERDRCQYHATAALEFAEPVNRFLSVAVGLTCLGGHQFIGRSWGVADFLPALRDFGVQHADPLRGLLARLGKRGFVVGYQWVSSNDGINGWLNPEETVELAERLDRLPLPKYGASFDAMQQFRRPHPLLYERFGIKELVCDGFSFEALSLSFIGTVAKIAAKRDCGILWGNDVSAGQSCFEIYFDRPVDPSDWESIRAVRSRRTTAANPEL